MKYILDENGEPKQCEDICVWGNWFEKAERRVALTNIDDKHIVSTVFLGINHNHFSGPPVLWETMVFNGEGEGQWFDRCAGTREQAEAMHNRMCRKLTQQSSTADRIVHGLI